MNLIHQNFGNIRVEKKGEDFIFCAKDVCDILGLENASKALLNLDEDEKLMRKIYVSDLTLPKVTSGQSLDDDEKLIRKVFVSGSKENLMSEKVTSGQRREMLFVTESGLYTLIIRSNKPQARRFRKWITSEVLPALRKYGTYSLDPKVMDNARKCAEQKKIKELLKEVDGGLSCTDKRLIARQCQTDEYEVWKVLRGDREDAYMMALCYSRATGNKLLHKQFYTAEGAENLLKTLIKK